MTLVKLTQNGIAVYVNPAHVALVTAHPELVNRTNVTLVTGINIQADGAGRDLADKFGYEESLLA